MLTPLHASLYWPLTWVSLALDYAAWGMNPSGYHLTSLLLHSANAALFYFVALRLMRLALGAEDVPETPLRLASGFAAMLFALHPLNVEAVAWASARGDVLSALFFFCVLLCYLNAATVRQEQYWRWMTAAIAGYVLALLSKASVAPLPAVLLLLDVYPLKRLGGGPGKWFGPAARKIWREKVPFILLALAAGAVALVGKREHLSSSSYGFWYRAAQILYGLAFYLRKTVAPVGLSHFYPLSGASHPWGLGMSAVLLAAVALGLFALRRRWPAGLAVGVYYLAMTAPALTVMQFICERYG